MLSKMEQESGGRVGRRLPSREEVLIIRPTGKQGQVHFVFEQVAPNPRGPARKPGIPKQDPNAKRSRRNAVLLSFEEQTFLGKAISQKDSISRRTKEPY